MSSADAAISVTGLTPHRILLVSLAGLALVAVGSPPAPAEGPQTAAATTGLEGTRWKARLIAGRRVPAGAFATVTFRRGRVSGRHWCNGYGGRYRESSGSRLRIWDLRGSAAACDANLPDFVGALTKTRRYRRTARSLVLEDRNGRTLARLVRW